MKKIFIFIISTILAILIGLGIIGYYVEKNKAKENEIKTEEKVEDLTEEKLVLDVEKFDINQIEGYTPGQNLVSEGQNEINDMLQDSTNTEEISVGGIKLPYSLPYKNMEIVSIGEYSGKFVEDGSDKKTDNLLAMIVKNTSDEVIDYGEIIMKISGKPNTIKFKITNLKPGASTLVMESSGKVEFNPKDIYKYLDSKNNMVKSLSLMESQVKVTTKGKEITVENLSDKDLKTVYVYYKTVSPGNCYLGGVTYRVKFENIKSGATLTNNTIHFSNDKSEIVKVECIK